MRRRWRRWRLNIVSRLALVPLPGPARISASGRLVSTVRPRFVERPGRDLF